MAKMVQLTQPDGNPALINAEAVLLVITPNANLGVNPAAKALVYVGGQQIAVTETVAKVKEQL
jgi:hypothetical protein